jgi:hypothetical protein
LFSGFPIVKEPLYTPVVGAERRLRDWIRKRCGNECRTKLGVTEMVDAGGRNVKKEKKIREDKKKDDG